MSNTIVINSFKTPVGELILGSFQGKLCIADWKYRKMRTVIDTRIQKGLKAIYVEGTSVVIAETKQQFKAYFKQEITQFKVPLLFVGTPFQKTVWKALQEIPLGETRSYLQLSKQMGKEKAIRAVASANGANAISIIVPCHRIIGSNGSLVGYAGGLPAKQKLLTLENALQQQQLSLF